ncbi:MAG: hypothetical protein ACRYGP_13375 [Janthinobacterium lividum]
MTVPTPGDTEMGGFMNGPPRRAVVLAGVLSAMLGVGIVSGAYMLRHGRLPPDRDGGPRCSRLFDARLHAARGGSDADLMVLSDAALDAGCGAKAFAAADAVGGATDEAAAWRLARFYDSAETAPVYRVAVSAQPAAAADLYATWASRSPRMAEALRRLCATDGAQTTPRACRRPASP